LWQWPTTLPTATAHNDRPFTHEAPSQASTLSLGYLGDLVSVQYESQNHYSIDMLEMDTLNARFRHQTIVRWISILWFVEV